MDPFVGRFDQLIDYLNITPYKLAKEISTSEAIISNIRAGKTKPSYDFLQKLLNKYKVINANWLIVGIGDMLLNKTSPASRDARDVNNADNNREDVMSLLHKIKSGQDMLLANFSKVLKIDEQVPEQPSDKSPQGDLVKKALEKLDDLKSDLEDK